MYGRCNMKNRRNRACILLIVFLVSWWSRKPVAVKAEGEQFAEQLYARSAVLMDADTGRILYGKSANTPMAKKEMQCARWQAQRRL